MTSRDRLRQRNTDAVLRFLAEMTEIDPDAATPSQTIYEAYLDWHRANLAGPSIYRDVFLKLLMPLAGTGDDVFRAQRRIGGRVTRVLTGIRLKDRPRT